MKNTISLTTIFSVIVFLILVGNVQASTSLVTNSVVYKGPITPLNPYSYSFEKSSLITIGSDYNAMELPDTIFITGKAVVGSQVDLDSAGIDTTYPIYLFIESFSGKKNYTLEFDSNHYFSEKLYFSSIGVSYVKVKIVAKMKNNAVLKYSPSIDLIVNLPSSDKSGCAGLEHEILQEKEEIRFNKVNQTSNMFRFTSDIIRFNYEIFLIIVWILKILIVVSIFGFLMYSLFYLIYLIRGEK